MPDLGLNWKLRSALRSATFGFGLASVTATVDGDDFGMMEQAVEDCAGGRDIAVQFPHSSMGRLEVIMVERFS
jgi:hypothetical protein